MNQPGRRPSVPAPARFAISALVVLIVALAAGVGAGHLADQDGPVAMAGAAILFTAILAASIGTGLWWWVKLDEAAREAHKWAFWWGGSAGMALGAVLLLTLTAWSETVLTSGWIGETPTDAFKAGVVAILLFQVIGYAIAWAAWWLRRR